ncbi:Dimethylallyl tryptophan synthase [Tolypocladium paradoxum]|uniref:Dimethylallyl tryptophan synthase n=1 Tax=Tolypocladium paradoxum TaxID=94208 RepID=A0A2S4KQB1_9HYPO|nr:Dimethylallyl tryptophan synthase [Tolypocladium paradoxum]
MTSSAALIPSNYERATRIDQPPPSPVVDSMAWHRINSDCHETLGTHGNYWWQRSGYALAILLGKAGYSYAAQTRILDFFARSIAPRLGVANEPGVERWKSFMTDNHNPIELSWDWHTGHKPPTVRFSIEPVGKEAGTLRDPYNEHAPREFLEAALRDLPAANMHWFNHFESYFHLGITRHSATGHQSKVFWAFDLDEKDIAGKAYFFPGYRASAVRQTNVQVISDAIHAAPSCKPEDLKGLYVFQEYAREQAKAPLEMDMLAIDLVEPSQSRLKIYFRSRETSFQSVITTMTLGGRLANNDTDAGLRSLRRLWDGLFGQQGVPDASPLSASKHRTAGILYYVEFRLGSKAPKVKVYLPVRHYAQNDWQIMNAVGDFMSSAKVGTNGVTQSDKIQAPLAYREAMCKMLPATDMTRFAME